MDPIQPGPNPVNNPRLDLLHNTGDNQQLRGVAGSYGPDATAFHAQGVSPAPPTPGPVRPQAAYMAAAKSKAPQPEPEAAPAAPEPRVVMPSSSSDSKPSPQIVGPGPSRGGRVLRVFLILLVLAAAGAGGWYYWTHRAQQPAKPAGVAVTPVTPTNLIQLDSNNTSLDAGATTQSGKVTFEFNVHTSATTGSLTPEVEVEPLGTAFTGTPNATGSEVNASSNMQFKVTSNSLSNGSYHWQARVSTGGQHSNWAVFGSDATAAAFVVNATAPAAPTVSTVGGASVANPTVVTTNRPPITGTAQPQATITVNVSPDSQKFTTTADNSGAWTLIPNTDIPNGTHQLSITQTNTAGVTSAATTVALSVNPATASDTTPSPAATPTTPTPAPAASTPTPSPTTAAATPAPATSSNLAATGDNTTLISVASLTVMFLAAAGIVWMRRRYATR